MNRHKNRPRVYKNRPRVYIYADKYDKFLFGTDWPLVPAGACVNFVKELVPEEYWNDVFFNNALNVFPKLKILLDETSAS